MKSRLILIMLIALSLISVSHPAPTAAQNNVDPTCAEFVTEVEASIAQLCPPGEGACYVHGPIAFMPRADADVTFANPGDRVSMDDVQSIHTAPINVEAQEWGVATLDFPAPEDAPADTPPSHFLMLGDVNLTRVTEGEGPEAFVVVTSGDEPACQGAPNKLGFETPDGVRVDFSVNGATLSVDDNTVLVLEAQPYDHMTLMVVVGSVAVTAHGQTQIISTGQQTIILLGGENGLTIMASPGEATPFSFTLIQFLPFQALISASVVEVPALDRWTPTGVELEAGQTYLVIGSGLVRTIESMPWTGPQGHSEADCAAAGRDDWGDCKCRTLPEWGQCTVDGLDCMRLVGRVGDGAPFAIGSGGFFTATTAGELMLGPNDNTFTDNVGAFHAIVIAIDLTPDTTPVPEPTPTVQ